MKVYGHGAPGCPTKPRGPVQPRKPTFPATPTPATNTRSSCTKGKGSPYSTAEHRVPELIPVLGSQPTGDVNHKPGGRLPLLSARPAVIFATLRAATSFAAW